jgi:prolyl-tRNA editing enzyme YbaK/EbsC (Cys-tRNA(Pro) deacylase)
LASRLIPEPLSRANTGWHNEPMVSFRLGSLSSVPVRSRPELVASVTRAELERAGLSDDVGVVEIDPAVSDTAATQAEFGLPPDSLANCVVVGGKREGDERIAACLVLATTRADVNNLVKRRLDVRKASFLPMDRAVELTGMEYGGITPVGLPAAWPVLVDSRVVDVDVIVIGSGVRRSKLLLPGSLVPRLAGVEIVEGLGQLI